MKAILLKFRSLSRKVGLFPIIFTLSFVLIQNLTLAQSATLIVDRDTIKIGEQAILDLAITFNAAEVGDELYWPQFADTLTSQIELIGESDIDTLQKDFSAETQITLHQQLIITCWEPGTFIIPPISFMAKTDSVFTNNAHITAISPEVNPDDEFKDIKGIYDVNDTLIAQAKKNWSWIVLSLVIIAVVLFFLLRKKKPATPLQVSSEARLSAHEKALAQLDVLYKKLLWQQGHVKEYHTELTDILRQFIESRFAIHAREEISSHIIRDLRRVVSDSQLLNDVQHTLMMADMAKFARQKPLPHENETAFVVVKHFVEKHIPKQEANNA